MTHAWDRTYLHSTSDGRLTGYRETNDNLDRGIPSEYEQWQVRFDSIEALRRRYPKASPFRGCSGVQVEIFLDGEHWNPSAH